MEEVEGKTLSKFIRNNKNYFNVNFEKKIKKIIS